MGDVESSWTYVDQELEIVAAIIGWPMAPLFVAVSWLANFEWDDPYMDTSDVVLHFEGEKLARWEVIEPVPVVSSGRTWQQQQWEQEQWQWQQRQWQQMKDIKHHKKGHTHHHGHD